MERKFGVIFTFICFLVKTNKIVCAQNNELAPQEPSFGMCLQCICVAVSNCSLSVGCVNTNGVKFCGPFRMTDSYWKDGGSPRVYIHDKPNSNEAFVRCATNFYCALKTVINYITVEKKDCNRNDKIDECIDHLHKHINGRYDNCFSSLPADRVEQLNHCLNPNNFNNTNPIFSGETVNM